jgi:serine/threonine protein phosphatase PrpC
VKKHYVKCLTSLDNYKRRNYKEALEESFLKMDDMMITDQGQKELMKIGNSKRDESYYSVTAGKSFAGCTATVLLVTPSEVFCANAGDSRTVLSKRCTAVDLSKDHKPDDPEESKRIYTASGFVEDSRVNGMLALSRALGDFEYKSN